ncbi:MAG: DegT/DnrJ/EryC1/StrS family aminotransferase [Phycisphaerales bacterium]|nr:DegT/DnrJ/EryC1/StrS family aminotransferase [Phycisphaerales bacterium]
MATTVSSSSLAINGGPKAVEKLDEKLFHWPIVTSEDEQAVLEVLRAGNMSGTDITQKFEAEWGQYLGTRYNLGHCNGTMALLSAMFAVGLGRGDELILPSITYWASGLQAYSLGATPVFADIDPVTLTIDPKDIEHRITPKTKAICVVHYCGHPCDMDAILPIARKHKLKVIEDVSHAQGTLYKGRRVGAMGDVAGISMMAGKSFPIGEGGMFSTNDSQIYQRAVAFAHYERIGGEVTDPKLRSQCIGEGRISALPLGGVKGRMNQTSSAMGRVQLKHYEKRIKEIQDALNRFWDLLEGVPGIRPHRPAKGSGSTMGGWYNPLGHYLPEELGGLHVDKFVKAVDAEGGRVGRNINFPLHLSPVFLQADIYRDGKPTRNAFTDRDVRQPAGSLPHSEAAGERCVGVPYFKHDDAQAIARYAEAYKKVALRADELL